MISYWFFSRGQLNIHCKPILSLTTHCNIIILKLLQFQEYPLRKLNVNTDTTITKSGTDFKSTNLDIALAIIATVGLPILCAKFYDLTGALLPLAIYYGVFCYGIVKWRKGTLDYRWPKKLITPLFLGLFIIQVLIAYCVGKLAISVEEISLGGFTLTLIIWAPLNAFAEQLIWIYIYDAFANRFEGKTLKIIFSGLGLLFYWGMIALIHILFWTKFLMEFHHTPPLYWYLFMGLQYPLTIGYIIIYRKTKSMYPIALLHLFQDVVGLLAAGYSIVPYLIK